MSTISQKTTLMVMSRFVSLVRTEDLCNEWPQQS